MASQCHGLWQSKAGTRPCMCVVFDGVRTKSCQYCDLALRPSDPTHMHARCLGSAYSGALLGGNHQPASERGLLLQLLFQITLGMTGHLCCSLQQPQRDQFCQDGQVTQADVLPSHIWSAPQPEPLHVLFPTAITNQPSSVYQPRLALTGSLHIPTCAEALQLQAA